MKSTDFVPHLVHDMTDEQMWIIGQDPRCHVRVMDPYASDHHCAVYRIGNIFAVADLGSTNGTFIQRHLGGQVKVTSWTRIYPGDTLIVGRSQIPWVPRGEET